MIDLETLGFTRFFSAQLELLELGGWDARSSSEPGGAKLERPEWVPARIVESGRNVCRLGGCDASLGELSGRLRSELRGPARPATGDWVAVVEDGERAIIHHVFDRQSALVRRAAGSDGAGQVVAANVDRFFIVTAVDRDFNLRRLERYLAAVWDSGAQPVVVLNKIDLGGDVDAMTRAIEQVALAVPVTTVSAATGERLDGLRAHLAPGETVGLIGSSGVGKSTLVNQLIGRVTQSTSELRVNQKGRHTTTRRELLVLPGGGILIDTPGMRELGLVDAGAGVEVTFADITALAADCHFADCRHEGEPACAVQAAVDAGALDPDRLESFHKLARETEAAARRRDPMLAGRSKQRWKEIAKSARAMSRIDPKQRG